MKPFYFILILFCCVLKVNAQVNVLDCSVNTSNLSQAEINAQDTLIGTCITLGNNGDIQINAGDSKTIYAKNEIHILPGVDLGSFSEDGNAHFKITAKSELNVFVMNYPSLEHVLRYKKLEFGVELPDTILMRINQFLHEKDVHSNQLNPFLAWEIAVEAHFTHKATGKTQKIDGFYTREYEVNTLTDDWEDIGTNFPFRIRFAPPLNGEWEAYLQITVHKGQELGYLSNIFEFNVIESGDPGFVKVHENKRNLKRGERMIFPVGINFPFPQEGTYFGHDWVFTDETNAYHIGNGPSLTQYYGHKLSDSKTNTEKATNAYHWKKYLNTISVYLNTNRGSNTEPYYIRTMQYPESSLIEFEEKGNYYKRLHYAYEQDKLLDTLEKYNSLMHFNLMYQRPLFKYEEYGAVAWDWDYHWYDENGNLPTDSSIFEHPRYCYNDQPMGTKEPHEMFTNVSDLNYHKQRIRYYNARYGYSTKIMEFEILSEPWHLGQQPEIKDQNGTIKIAESIPYHTDVSVQQAILDYHRVVSEYMRDSLHSNQLIGADMGLEDDVFSEPVAKLPKIDVIGLNLYYGGPADVYDKIAPKLTNVRNILLIDKPFIFSEGGLDEEYQLCSDFTQYPIDVMTYPFTGAAGYFTWNGWRDNEHYLQAIAIRANYHTNGEDVINTLSEGGGYWTQNGSEVELKTFGERYKLIEQQHYISSNKKMAVGYVKNRTFNYFTRSNSFQCSVLLTDMTIGYILPLSILWNSPPLNQRLQLTNLNHGKKYRIDWYSVFSSQNNGYLKTDNVTATLGKITLKYPPLIVASSSSLLDRPAVWYVLRQVDEFERPIQDSDTNFISLDKRMISEIILDKNENNGNELNANIYPNPFHSKLIVTSLEDDEFIIITPTGNIVLQQRVLKGINNVSIKHLPKGSYFGKLVNQQFIIKLEQL